MTSAAGSRLAFVLGAIESPGAFSSRRTAPAAGLSLQVTGLGQIQLPVPNDQAKQLYLLGRPARFGQGDMTLVDRHVRDTQELPRSLGQDRQAAVE
jgi:hypothetical protein